MMYSKINAAGKLCVSAFCRKSDPTCLKLIILQVYNTCKELYLGAQFFIHCKVHSQKFNILFFITVKYILKIPMDLSPWGPKLFSVQNWQKKFHQIKYTLKNENL